MTQKEKLLQEADALRDLAFRTRRAIDFVSDNRKIALRRRAVEFDSQASALEAMAGRTAKPPIDKVLEG